MSTFYEQRMLMLFVKYDISDQVQMLIKNLEEVKTARMDETRLATMIRMSPTNRSALVDTMVKCAEIMKNRPREGNHCMSIITACSEILNMPNKSPVHVGVFPFQKLPAEIRQRVYDIYLGIHPGARFVIALNKCPQKGNSITCDCAVHEPPAYEVFNTIPIDLALTNKAISQEILLHFYRQRKFYFCCACDMGMHLEHNMMLKSVLTTVAFNWHGIYASRGTSQLHKCKRLERLHIVISKKTSMFLTPREAEIRRFFGGNRRSAPSTTLPESLGWDELVALRGLKEVVVHHIDKRKAARRTDDERASLQAMLRALCLRRDHDQDDGEDWQ